MNDQPNPSDNPSYHAEEWADAMQAIGQRSYRIVQDFLDRQNAAATDGTDGSGDDGDARSPGLDPLGQMTSQSNPLGHGDALNIGNAFLELSQAMMRDPLSLMQAQTALWQDYAALWQNTARRMAGEDAPPAITPEKDDRRFRDDAWSENAVFDFIKQSYLLGARWLQDTVRDVEGLDTETARKVDFYTRQFADAMAPTNFVATNPQVLRETIDTKGENLIRGLENMLQDMERGKGRLKISMTDRDAFEVGVNIATSPGKVVFRNDLMELIQYSPTTETVHARPLLIVPPWINKFYILDLKPKNSFIRWAVAQGLTVFVVSWVNPDAEMATKNFDDYLAEGPLAALDAIEQATGMREINLVGYCLGGTLSACALAHMKAGGDMRVTSATYFTTLIDFAEAGELSVFVDEEQVASLERKMNARGYLEGSEMAATFNMLRANDLIWSFVVNNYLMGKDPFPFDLLYWNSDSTRMPAAMHSYYLRRMYLENKLIEPGGLTLLGRPIDLTTLDVPTFVLSTQEDHIAPWKSTFAAVTTYAGPVKFCLAGSGHIAGVVNPPNPEKPKYGYWTRKRNTKTADSWLAGATRHDGSWWPEWKAWLEKYAGKQVPARIPGDGALPVIEDAPGAYVRVQAQ